VRKDRRDTGQETADLINNYRPLQLKAVVAATTVRSEPKAANRETDHQHRWSMWEVLEMPFSD